jgi:hypothetical protein
MASETSGQEARERAREALSYWGAEAFDVARRQPSLVDVGPLTLARDVLVLAAENERLTIAAGEHPAIPSESEAVAFWKAQAERAVAEAATLREALEQVRLASLLRIRQAAFSPKIGVRYTEAIRADISNACFALEDYIEAALMAGREPT